MILTIILLLLAFRALRGPRYCRPRFFWGMPFMWGMGRGMWGPPPMGRPGCPRCMGRGFGPGMGRWF